MDKYYLGNVLHYIMKSTQFMCRSFFHWLSRFTTINFIMNLVNGCAGNAHTLNLNSNTVISIVRLVKARTIWWKASHRGSVRHLQQNLLYTNKTIILYAAPGRTHSYTVLVYTEFSGGKPVVIRTLLLTHGCITCPYLCRFKMEKSKKSRKCCAVFGCVNTNGNRPELSFFSLPTEDSR